jgi:hypothetical protein
MVKEYTFGMMEINIKENGLMIKEKDKAIFNKKMVIFMKANGKMI